MTASRISTVDNVNRVTRTRVFIGIFAALGAFAAHAASPQVMKLALQPQKGHFTEQCFTLAAGQQLSYRFTTPHPIEFNLHHHPVNGPTTFPDRLTVNSQHSKQLVAASAGAYCFMATNAADQSGAFEVVINYEIAKQ